ncbi:MAG: AgmX/PglI C-terminal domain-containing protein [Polyangiales bacterium]
MRTRTIPTRALLVATLAAATGCGKHTEPRGPGAPAAPARAPAAHEATGPFTIHEWGLVGVVAGASTGAIASGVSAEAATLGRGLPGAGYGGKPVLYVHLDEGTNATELDVSLGLPASSVVERFPPTSSAASVAWTSVHATRGACAEPTAAPSHDSLVCRGTPDGFCEAAELPRYEADRDVCLAVGDARVHSLFYRASGLDTSSLPISLELGDGASLRRSTGARLEGPVLYLEKRGEGAPTIRALAPDVGSGPVPTGIEGTISVSEARTRLVAEARRRGLTEAEAEAFVDAWSPAFFDTCRRTGPEASGAPPAALAPTDRSLLYFAPEALVDAVIPLETRPRARATHRVFLVRVVEPPPMGHGGGGFFSGESRPRGVSAPMVRMEQAEVRGSLPSEVVRRVARRNINQVRYCYELGLRVRPELAGRVVVAAVIGTDGTISNATLRSSTLPSPDVESCIVSAVRRWQFPSPESGVVVWNQPFLLVNEEE